MEESFRRIIREELERIFRLRNDDRLERGGDHLAPSPLVSIPIAAAQVGLSASKIRRWRDEGKLTPYGKGRSSRVDPQEVRKVMLEEARPTASSSDDVDARVEAVLRRIG